MVGKLHVVQVLPALQSGGVERGTLEVAEYLVQHGHRSTVISAGGRMVSKLKAAGSHHVTMDIGRKSLCTLRFINRLKTFLIENQVDILHVRSRFPAWICYLVWKSMDPITRPKLITTVHGPYSVNAYSKIMTKGEQVIVISKMIRDYVIKNYQVSPEKLMLNYRGVSDTDHPYGYQPSDKWLNQWYLDYPQTRNKLLITLPGRLTRWKGQLDFIEVIAKIKPINPQVHGLIVGEAKKGKTAFLETLKQKVDELELTGNISFTGHRSDVREVMAISNIVMSLSTTPEAFGRISIEALSMGRPVIAYAHGGVEEQLSQILPSGLVTVGDTEKVANLAAYWLEKPPIIPEKHSFSLQSMLENTLTVYRKAIGSGA
jgi:glycosyltransferase involved in cell wall biosynthesis